MLKLENFNAKRDDRALFMPLTFELAAGDCVELLGRNGAGKSTLLRSLCGLHMQTEGEFTCSPFVYQGHRLGLDELMSPLENLAWFTSMEGASFSEAKAGEILQRVGVRGQALRPCGHLSQGQQRRVAMARWLFSERALWLLDEPFTALDVQAQGLLNEIVGEHCANGGAVLCATHVELHVAQKRSIELEVMEAAP